MALQAALGAFRKELIIASGREVSVKAYKQQVPLLVVAGGAVTAVRNAGSIQRGVNRGRRRNTEGAAPVCICLYDDGCVHRRTQERKWNGNYLVFLKLLMSNRGQRMNVIRNAAGVTLEAPWTIFG